MFMGSSAAAEDNFINNSHVYKESNNSCNTVSSLSANTTTAPYDGTEYEFSENINASTEELDYLSGCCSVLLHVRDGYDVFAIGETQPTQPTFILQ